VGKLEPPASAEGFEDDDENEDEDEGKEGGE
jgi:hypothetical protein